MDSQGRTEENLTPVVDEMIALNLDQKVDSLNRGLQQAKKEILEAEERNYRRLLYIVKNSFVEQGLDPSAWHNLSGILRK